MLTKGQVNEMMECAERARDAAIKVGASTRFFDDLKNKLIRYEELRILYPTMEGHDVRIKRELSTLMRSIKWHVKRLQKRMAHCVDANGKVDGGVFREIFGTPVDDREEVY